jgi:group I intron endonuclease
MKGIYKIRNMINKKVYIGQTDRLNEREREHFYRLERCVHHNEHLQKSFNKYGKDNFKFEIIELTEDLDDRELYWLNEYGGLNSNNTYNFKDPKTKEWSEYTKVKQSKSMLGENNPNYGNKWSEEQKEKLSKMKKGKTLEDRIGKERAELAKQKMSKSQKGRKHPEEVKEKIRQANIGENNPAYGKGDRQRGENNPNYNKPMPNRKPVLKLNKEGELIKEYEFLDQVKEDGFNPSNVMYCANGVKGYKQSKGFYWKWKE